MSFNFVIPEGESATVAGGAIGATVSGGSLGDIAQSAFVGGVTGAAVGAVVGGLAGAGIIGPLGLVAGDFAAGFNVGIGAKGGTIAGFMGALFGQTGSVLVGPDPANGSNGEACN